MRIARDRPSRFAIRDVEVVGWLQASWIGSVAEGCRGMQGWSDVCSAVDRVIGVDAEGGKGVGLEGRVGFGWCLVGDVWVVGGIGVG